MLDNGMVAAPTSSPGEGYEGGDVNSLSIGVARDRGQATFAPILPIGKNSGSRAASARGEA